MVLRLLGGTGYRFVWKILRQEALPWVTRELRADSNDICFSIALLSLAVIVLSHLPRYSYTRLVLITNIATVLLCVYLPPAGWTMERVGSYASLWVARFYIHARCVECDLDSA